MGAECEWQADGECISKREVLPSCGAANTITNHSVAFIGKTCRKNYEYKAHLKYKALWLIILLFVFCKPLPKDTFFFLFLRKRESVREKEMQRQH